MKIALTGARGSVGKLVAKLLAEEGHSAILINRTEENGEDHGHERRTADAGDYDGIKAAFEGADAVIHLAAIPDPVGKDDHYVHNNNVTSSYNAVHAAAALGIKRFVYASSVNAIGLAFSQAPPQFDYFPIDEEHPRYPSDAYALAKAESEIQFDCMVRIHPEMRIASLRIHEVAPLADVKKEHDDDSANARAQLYAWVNPQATARTCVLAATVGEFKGHEIFNIVAPTTTRKTPSRELATKEFPNVPIKGTFEGNTSFWSCEKAKRVLGWEHVEQE